MLLQHARGCPGGPWRCSLGLLGRLEDQSLVDVRDDTTAGNSSLDEGVELFVTSDGELQMSGCNSLHLQVLAGVSGELKNLSGQVLEDGCSVDC